MADGQGVLTSNGDGTWTFTPKADWNGSVTFTYTVSDGKGGTADATANLVVNPVNDAPLAEDASINATEDTVLTGPLSATDPDSGDTLTFVLATGPPMAA